MHKRNKRAIIAGLLFEGVHALGALIFGTYGIETFLDSHRRVLGALHWASCKAEQENFTDETLGRAFQHERTQNSLETLFDQDDTINYSEIAGMITLDNDATGPFLRFYTAPTENQRFAELLINAENPRSVIHANESFYREITEMSPGTYQSNFNRLNPEALVRTYLRTSDNKSVVDKSLLHYAQLFRLEGTFVGYFHLHNDYAPPSTKDKELEHFVITRTHPYSFYRTGNGTAVRISN